MGHKLRKDVVGTCGLFYPGHQRPHSGGRRRDGPSRSWEGGSRLSPSVLTPQPLPPPQGLVRMLITDSASLLSPPPPARESTPQDRRLRAPLLNAHCSAFKPHLVTSFCRRHVAAVVLTVRVWTSCRRLAVDLAFPPVLELSPA